jgi:hypothetical protein
MPKPSWDELGRQDREEYADVVAETVVAGAACATPATIGLAVGQQATPETASAIAVR